MARARHCLIFKHQPPSQSGCALAQLCKDLSTPLGTGIGDTALGRFRHAEATNPNKVQVPFKALLSPVKTFINGQINTWAKMVRDHGIQPN
jgi:hypothetical protein